MSKAHLVQGLQKVLELDPWTEIVGEVEEAGRDNVTLRCAKLISIGLSQDLSGPSRNLLSKGNKVGILVTEQGLRIRLVSGKEAS